MATTTSSLGSSSSTAQLSSTYQSLVNSIMTQESKPLTTLTNQRDSVQVQKGVYTDLLSSLNSLQTQVGALVSTGSSYAITTSKSASVSNQTDSGTVFTASSSSNSLLGVYDISVATLARQHRVASSQQASSSNALGLVGTIIVGGGADRSGTAVTTVSGTVDSFGTADIASGKTELASGNYYIETRHDSGSGWQFRLVDTYGEAVSIRLANGSYGSGWQTLSDGTFDTGRGLTISFGADPSAYQVFSKGSGAAQVDYTAKGVSLSINQDESLSAIAQQINNGTYVAGNEVQASVINRQLVLTAKNSGTAHAIEASGVVFQNLGLLGSDGSFSHVLNSATDASFTVNNMSVVRSSNSGITDLIPGVTLNLASDAEGKSATLTIGDDTSSATTAIKSFISQYNALQTYLTNKTALTKVSDTQYKRGALTGETSITSLRSDLIQQFTASATNDGIFSRLSDLGLSINDKFQISISDSAKLNDAIQNHLSDFKQFLDAKMGKMDTIIKRFTGTSGIVTLTSKGLDEELEQDNDRIDAMNARLAKRKNALTSQYLALQSEMTSLNYLQQQMALFASYYSSTSA